MDTRIYVMTHKEYVKPEDDMYISLHVGKALGNDFGYVGDDTGDNISEKNRNYCELTGMYWLWKNVKCDIVGICHYRRYFVVDEDFIKKDYIESVLSEYDIIVPGSAMTPGETVGKHYEKEHYWKDMQLCRDVIGEKYPEYLDAFDLCMNCNMFSVGNMVITKKEIYDEYCQWLFDVLFEVEKRCDISEYDTFQARIYGFLSERLFRVWMLNRKYRIREEEMRMLDPQDANNGAKSVELKYKYVSLLLNPLVQKYQRSIEEPVFCSEPLPVDFNGKIPVWVLWLQGMEQAPELVRMCVKSLENNIPKDVAELRVLTIDNLADYIRVPDWIMKKVNEGTISLTHFSDIIRMGLLYRYGGMWIDATYYVNRPMHKGMFEREFFTLRQAKSKWRADIVQARWAGNFLVVKPGNLLAKFVLEAFYEYWKVSDKMIDYFLIDYVIALAYNTLPQVKEMIDNCPYSEPQIFELAEVLNSKWSQEKIEALTADTAFFKLSYKVPVAKENVVGEKTFYGYLVETVL
ncbi:MAG: DUF4422 domain-containing protein [Lachnospira sp.]|nr:DUF4422 domain-containing protein [Lachnospira sp.]